MNTQTQDQILEELKRAASNNDVPFLKQNYSKLNIEKFIKEEGVSVQPLHCAIKSGSLKATLFILEQEKKHYLATDENLNRYAPPKMYACTNCGFINKNYKRFTSSKCSVEQSSHILNKPSKSKNLMEIDAANFDEAVITLKKIHPKVAWFSKIPKGNSSLSEKPLK